MSAVSQFPPPHLVPQDEEGGSGGNDQERTDSDECSSERGPPMLGLPAPRDAPETAPDDDDGAVKFDRLGPVMVNADGSLSRIHNWAAMTDAERATTLRVINKRNQTRLALLREAGANQESTVSITEDANAQQTANRGSSGAGAAAAQE